MNTPSLRIWFLISFLIIFASAAAGWPAAGRTEVILTPSIESESASVMDAWLVKRGLLGRAMIGEQSGGNIMTAPPGVEVDETRQTENHTGELVTSTKSWNEMVDDFIVHIEITTLSTNQFEIAFWLFPNHRKGCSMYHWTLYDRGRLSQSAFWRNDATLLHLAGAPDLPHDLYPDSVPWSAFLRVLSAPREGAEGMLDQQITPYSYVGQEVVVKGPERITVPAGTFSALKLTAQVNIATIMPNWPRFVLSVIKPVVPKNTLYFDSQPPYRLLKQQGTTFVGGPEVTTELIRFYIVPGHAVVATAFVSGVDPSDAAVIEGTPGLK